LPLDEEIVLVFLTPRDTIWDRVQSCANGGNKSWDDENRAMKIEHHLKILVLEIYLVFM